MENDCISWLLKGTGTLEQSHFDIGTGYHVKDWIKITELLLTTLPWDDFQFPDETLPPDVPDPDRNTELDPKFDSVEKLKTSEAFSKSWETLRDDPAAQQLQIQQDPQWTIWRDVSQLRAHIPKPHTTYDVLATTHKWDDALTDKKDLKQIERIYGPAEQAALANKLLQFEYYMGVMGKKESFSVKINAFVICF